MRKSSKIIYFLLTFIVGILIRSFFQVPLVVWFIIALVALVSAFVTYQKNRELKILSILLLGGIFLFLGILRVEIFLPEVTDSNVLSINNQVVEFQGKINAEPDKRERNIQYRLDIFDFEGDVLMFGPKFPQYKFGESLEVTCRLEEPEKIDQPSHEASTYAKASANKSDGRRTFDYPGYLAKEGVYSVCFRPLSIDRVEKTIRHLELVSESGSRIPEELRHGAGKSGMANIQSWLITQKQNFKSIIDRSVNFPASSFVNSILLGLRREVPQNIQDNFSATGTSHLMAISGLHIVILSSIIFSLFRNLRIPKKKSFIFVVIFLIFFVGLIGFRASAIRAGVFGLVGIISFLVSRPKKAILVLLWAATILLLINPLLLVHDIGFQLSFLAVLGLVYLGPWLSKLLKKIPSELGVRDILVMTLSAQIFVLPWILYKFGALSIISPLANLLVLPVMPLVMILGFVLVIAGLLFLPLAQVFGWFVWTLVSYILLVVKYLAQIPLASWQVSLPLWGAFIIYAIFTIFICKPSREFVLSKVKIKRLGYKILSRDLEVVTEVIDLRDYDM